MGIGKKPRVGFYGCSRDGHARVVRVGAEKGREPASSYVDPCVVCGEAHLVEPLWRAATEYDEGREPEVILAPARNTRP